MLSRPTSAYPRQRFAEWEVDDSLAADGGAGGDEAGMAGHHPADAARFLAERVGAQRRQHALGALGGDEGDELALVGDVERIEPEDLAGAAHRVVHRDRILVHLDAELAARGDLDERRGDAAAGRI